MTDDRDEEALHWAGDLPDRLDTTDARSGTAPDAPPQTGSVLLVVYGIFGGAYLLYLIGWIVTASRHVLTASDPLGESMERISTVLAIAAPAAWFATVFLLTRRPAFRLIWLVVGLIVVAPWAFVTGHAG